MASSASSTIKWVLALLLLIIGTFVGWLISGARIYTSDHVASGDDTEWRLLARDVERLQAEVAALRMDLTAESDRNRHSDSVIDAGTRSPVNLNTGSSPVQSAAVNVAAVESIVRAVLREDAAQRERLLALPSARDYLVYLGRNQNQLEDLASVLVKIRASVDDLRARFGDRLYAAGEEVPSQFEAAKAEFQASSILDLFAVFGDEDAARYVYNSWVSFGVLFVTPEEVHAILGEK